MVEARRRRSAEEAQSIILEVAAKRLAEMGLEGLNIKGVAEEAGISHATLIHHFGSSGGMREALVQKMTLDLVEDLIEAFESKVPEEEMASNVFRALSAGGHAKLIAWQAVEGPRDEPNEHVVVGFARLIASMQKNMSIGDDSDASRVVMLVGLAAVGFGLAGPVLAQMLGLNEEDLKDFPAWMINHIN